jgi:transglutaminase-like putative cysteine protease
MKRALFPLLLSLFLLACAGEAPRIDSIHPRIGRMGEILSVAGKHFGDERGESYVTIAGISPTASSYLSWSDKLIVFRTPEFGESGLVYVHREGRKSNAALFANEAAIPEPVTGDDSGLEPRITALEPASGAVGSLVTIRGQNFGAAQGGKVYFAWSAEASSAAPAGTAPSRVEVSERDFGYESWSERELRVRVPDGAISGNVEVHTQRGASRPLYFEVNGRPGSKSYRNKRTYTITWSVDVKVEEASAPNTLYLWLPQPAGSAAQRPGELLRRSQEPFIENHQGLSLFKFNNPRARSSVSVSLERLVGVYSVETALRPQEIRRGAGGPLEAAYTRSDPLIPQDDPALKARASAITGREQNPYHRARLIYEWMIRNLEISPENREGGVAEALAEGKAGPWQAALLFCGLARAAGVPALPLSGVLVDRNRETLRHFWAEFWIQGFGWVPVDVALGAGAAPPSFNLPPEHKSWYFGNMDNQRITFSRGVIPLSRMEDRGRTVSREREYSLQSIWEEAAGGIESYSSLWGDVTITGVYME